MLLCINVTCQWVGSTYMLGQVVWKFSAFRWVWLGPVILAGCKTYSFLYIAFDAQSPFTQCCVGVKSFILYFCTLIMFWRNNWILICFYKCLKFHSFRSFCGNLLHTRSQQPKIDDRQTQFYNEVQSAGLESMNGANALVGVSVVCYIIKTLHNSNDCCTHNMAS